MIYPNPRTVRANRSGQLTPAQMASLTLSTLVTGGLAVLFGGLGSIVAINRFAAQTSDGVTLAAFGGLLLLGVFAVGLILYGLRRVVRLVHDLRSGIQSITGMLQAFKHRQPKPNVRGNVSFGTRCGLRVQPLTRSGDQPAAFPIGQDLYAAIQSHQENQVYTVYYVPGSKTVLSLEPETGDGTLT